MQKLPKEFSWSHILESDDDLLKEKKKYISDVKNQYLCGCCWAISCATAVGDAYVVSGLENHFPKPSFEYALMAYPQGGCNGGSGRQLLIDIATKGGLASEECFEGECSHEDKHPMFMIDEVAHLSATNPSDIFKSQELIKEHILNHGPVVGSFLIDSNFSLGTFLSKNSGVYIEDADFKPVGSHSVVIMGWGISKSVKMETGVISDVPFWYCRNSWGRSWGESGYFRCAMYPFNRISQFEKTIRVIYNGEITETGGVTSFIVKPKRFRRLKIPKLKNATTNGIILAAAIVGVYAYMKNIKIK